MLNSIGLTISGFVFILLIAIVYLSKKKYNNLQNVIYRFLLFTTIAVLILEFICVFTMYNSVEFGKLVILNEFLCRIYILAYIALFVGIIGYVRSLTINKTYNKPIEFFQEKFMGTLIIIASVLYFISCFFEFKFTSGTGINKVYVTGGLPVYVLYIAFAFAGGYMTVALLKDINKENVAKRVPLILFLIIYFFIGVIQLYTIDINDLTYLFAFSIIAIYFTLENQDVILVNELEIAKSEAERADKAKTAFLSKMSHEIRTPMNAIMGFSETLLNNNKLTTKELKEDVGNIYKAGNDLLEIINNILNLSRIESGREKLENLEYYIGDIVFELNSFIYARIDKTKVKFIIDIDQDIPSKLLGDRLKIYTVLSNILENSVQFTSKGEIKLSIRCKNEGNISHLLFEVSDTGQGIKKEDFEKVFNSFTMSEVTGDNYSGIGLGLVISKKLVEMMNGTISFDSEYGVGTKFYVKIDQQIIDKTEIGNILKEEGVSSKIKEKEFYFGCSKYSVLIVDDNKLNLKVVNRLLEPYNIKCENVESGKECIEKVKSGKKYDLIFLDHMMPDLDGIETIRILKKMTEKTLPPIVAMTANVVTEFREKYIKEGFDDYISKPIDIKRLNKLLKKYFYKEKKKRK